MQTDCDPNAGNRTMPEPSTLFRSGASESFSIFAGDEINICSTHVSDRHGRFQADSVLKVISGICRFHAARTEHYMSPIVKGMKRV